MSGVYLYILFLLTFNFKIAEDKVIAYLSITSNKTGKKARISIFIDKSYWSGNSHTITKHTHNVNMYN